MVDLFINAAVKHITVSKMAFVNITTNQSNLKQSTEQHLKFHIYTQGCFYLPEIKLTLMLTAYRMKRTIFSWPFLSPIPQLHKWLSSALPLPKALQLHVYSNSTFGKSVFGGTLFFIYIHLFDSMCPHCCWNVFNVQKWEHTVMK